MYDNQTGDTSDATFERSKDVGLKLRAGRSLYAVEEALKRMKEGRYGVCEICGKEIEPARLEAIPWTTLCVDCRRQLREALDPFKRPVEEDVLGVPFSRGFLDDTSQIMYDAEDAWQDVARYGTANSPQDVPPARRQDAAYVDSDEDRGAVDQMDKLPSRRRR